ncbi:MAG: transglycosylase domain-containing protein [Anaerolineaceae bacterium]
MRERRRPRKSAVPIWLLAIVALGVLGSLGLAASVGAVFAVYRSYAAEYVPIKEKLLQNNVGLTEVYDRGGPDGGVLLGRLTNKDAQLLNPVKLPAISPFLIEATVSTEDNSFWDNPGVNVLGLLRAAKENYLGGGLGSGTGGSSITQQLIKNVYICPSISADTRVVCTAERTLDRKLKEISFALELEKDSSKEEILEWYLNQISYADRYIGIQAAAQGYFHKDAIDLTLAESALLAGVPSAPTDYHPRLNCAKEADGATCKVDGEGRTTVVGKAKLRQEDVLDLMVTHKRVTREQAEAAKSEVITVFASSNPTKASAFIDNQVEPRLVRMCQAGILKQLPGTADCEASVHSAGYKVTTTLDWAETDVAEEMMRGFVADGLSKGCECNNAAIVTIEPTSGQVIIYAPNRDPSYVSDRRVAGDIDQLMEINQPGSSFKPAVYLNWFDTLGKSPMSTIWDTSPLTIEGTSITNPRNDGKTGEGLITARAALGGSQNVGAFRAAQEGGVDNVIAMAKKLGITTLDQHFDPTFRAHSDVTYGASIATGGANVRAFDMAYMNSVIANMGVMVGVPTLAKTVPLKDLKSTAIDTGTEYDLAVSQRFQFSRGNIRIPGTRELDPIVVLQVRDVDGNVVWTQGEPERKQVVDAGSVWLLHSVMSDCTARFVIWGCGGSNNDNALDFFLDGTKIPGGIKTGTQQGPKSAVDTLATWMNGYSRYAATSVWVGNADKSLVKDGPSANYAAANTTIHLFKNWMGEYHAYLQRRQVLSTLEGFASLQPRNVAQRQFDSPTTERGAAGGCDQKVTAWVRTDVKYESECETREIDSRNGFLASDQTPAQFSVTRKFVKLPGFKADLAIELAKERNIPIAPTEKSNGSLAVELKNISNGKTIGTDTVVVGSVQVPNGKGWKLEIGAGANPAAWTTIGEGKANVDGVLGTISIVGLADGVYTVRLTALDALGLSTQVTINVKKGAPGPGGTPSGTPGTPTRVPIPGATPTRTATPSGG